MSEDAQLFSQAAPLLFQDHDAILQTLDRTSISYAHGEREEIYLSKETYIPTVQEWNGTPVIFAEHHPEMDAYDLNPELELRRIKGREVGHVKDASINMTGHPKLIGKLALSDKSLEEFIATGQLSISTGVRAAYMNGKTTGEAKPHHVLLFPEDPLNIPGDFGSMILNKQEPGFEDATEEQLTEAWDILCAKSRLMGIQGEWEDDDDNDNDNDNDQD